MKWFTDPSRHPTDYGLLFTPPVIASFMLALVAVGIAYLIQHRVPEPRIFRSLERYAGVGPLALGSCVGVALMAAAAFGLLFVPLLRVGRDADGTLLLVAELLVGVALTVGLGTRAAALGLALLGAIAMVPFSFESILEQVHLLGAAIYLFVIGRGPISLDALLGRRRALEYEEAPRVALLILRVAMGFGIAFTALTEKLLDPSLAAALLADRPELNVLRGLGISDPAFVWLAGTIELVIGVVVVSGQVTRPAMAVGAFLFTMTLPLFGWGELLGHLPFYGMMLTLFLSPDADSPRVTRQLRGGELVT